MHPTHSHETIRFFILFPVLIQLRHLDHICRGAFPLMYLIVVVNLLSRVGFGATPLDSGHFPCYSPASLPR